MIELSRGDIALVLERLGLSAGDSVFVHSSLSSMGHVSGGAEAVADALLDVLGPRGTLMVPTFTFSGTTAFDARNSPSKTGAVTEAIRGRPPARQVRADPLHPAHYTVVTADDRRVDVVLTTMPGCSGGFGGIERPLRAAGQIRDGMIGAARCQLIRFYLGNATRWP